MSEGRFPNLATYISDSTGGYGEGRGREELLKIQTPRPAPNWGGASDPHFVKAVQDGFRTADIHTSTTTEHEPGDIYKDGNCCIRRAYSPRR